MTPPVELMTSFEARMAYAAEKIPSPEKPWKDHAAIDNRREEILSAANEQLRKWKNSQPNEKGVSLKDMTEAIKEILGKVPPYAKTYEAIKELYEEIF